MIKFRFILTIFALTILFGLLNGCGSIRAYKETNEPNYPMDDYEIDREKHGRFARIGINNIEPDEETGIDEIRKKLN